MKYDLKEQTAASISPIIKLSTNLRLLAKGGYQLGVRSDFTVNSKFGIYREV